VISDNTIAVTAPATKKQKSTHGTHHNSSVEAEHILQKYGTIHDVPADGNCGYHALLIVLKHHNVVHDDMTVSQLRKEIFQYAEENMNKFIGKEELGGDTVFKTIDGKVGYTYGQRIKKNPRKCRESVYVNSIIKGVYKPNVNYKRGAKCEYWMNAGNVLPIVVHKYQLPSLFLYSSINANTEQTHLGTMTFRSDIYSFEDDCVYFERKDGFVNNNTGVKYSLVLFDDRHHYMVLQGNE
jgi:hypothetical protein